MREIILVFEGGLNGNEEKVSDSIQSFIFKMAGKNRIAVRHFSSEQTDYDGMAAIRTPNQLPRELKIPEFMAAPERRSLL